jgi:hypothetical protein
MASPFLYLFKLWLRLNLNALYGNGVNFATVFFVLVRFIRHSALDGINTAKSGAWEGSFYYPILRLQAPEGAEL